MRPIASKIPHDPHQPPVRAEGIVGFNTTPNDEIDGYCIEAKPTCPRPGDWWTYDPALHLWVPYKLVEEFKRLYPTCTTDNQGNAVTEWICLACGKVFSTYENAIIHVGSTVVNIARNNGMTLQQKINTIKKTIKQNSRGEVVLNMDYFARKLGINPETNPLIYDMLMYLAFIPIDIFYDSIESIANRLRTDSEFKRLFKKWMQSAFCEGRIVALYDARARSTKGAVVQWQFPVHGMGGFARADGMVYQRNQILDPKGNRVGWTFSLVIVLEGKMIKTLKPNQLFKSFIHDLVATLRTTGRIDGIALMVLQDYRMGDFLHLLIDDTIGIRHNYWRQKIQVNGDTWNMAFVEEDKDLHTGTYIQYRFVSPSSSTDPGDYDVVDAIPSCYTVEYHISKRGTAISAVHTNQSFPTSLVEYEGTFDYRFHRTAQAHSDVVGIIDDFISNIIQNPGPLMDTISVPNSAPLIPELSQLRFGTQAYHVLEYLYRMAKMGYAVTSEDVGNLLGKDSIAGGRVLYYLRSVTRLTKVLEEQMVNFPVSTKAVSNPMINNNFWTLSTTYQIPITVEGFHSAIGRYNALRQGCLDLATHSELLKRWGRIQGESEWPNYTGRHFKARPEFVRNKIIQVQADFAQALFNCLIKNIIQLSYECDVFS